MAKRILSLFRNLFRKRAIEQALDDELRSTLEALTQEKIEQGLSQSVARREALIEIGGVELVKEGVRAVRAGHFVEHLAGDIRYGLRQLRRNRSFTALAALALERDRLLRQHDAEIATLRECFASLTGCEQQVLPWVISSLLNKQIAAEMGMTEATVKVHRSQLMRKMGAESLPDLVRMAERIGIPVKSTKLW